MANTNPSHSDAQKKHIATTLRLVGIGAFVTYSLPEITTAAISIGLKSSATHHYHHGSFLLAGFIIFGLAEVGAIRLLKGVKS